MAKTIVTRRHKPDTPDLSHIAEPLRHLAVPVSSLHEDPSNARLHDEANLAAVETSLRRFGQRLPLVVQRQGMVVRAGNARLAVAARLGWTHVAAIVVDEGDADAVAFAISDNRTAEMGRWDEAALGRLLKFAADQVSIPPVELSPIGFSPDEITRLISVADFVPAPDTGVLGSMVEKFVEPPFSVLDARSGRWQDRKREWIAKGIQSELGRKGDLIYPDSLRSLSNMAANTSGVSVFDPVLCELCYRWFSPPDAQVVDPFAGGSVRGIVAATLGRKYWGCDLSSKQVKANREQAKTLCPGASLKWTVGDSRDKLAEAPAADFVFSCPPYADLEIYSDDPADLSNMPWPEFLTAYKAIIAAACAKLRPGRFAGWVIGDVRDQKGICRNLPGLTITAFREAGLQLYNHAILVTPVGSLPIRAGASFNASRKLGNGHQHVLIFVKGSPQTATKVCAADVDDGTVIPKA